jgi:ABC-2 type transport system permease protein
MLTAPSAVLISLIFPVQAPASALHAAAFVAAVLGSVLLSGALNFIVGSFAVRMTTILGLLRAKFYVQELMSGLLVPMTMFPAPIERLAAWMPFEHIAYTPLRIYLGKLQGAELIEKLAMEWLWVGILMLLGAWFWRRMASSLSVQGG